jgi:hypothetical protein
MALENLTTYTEVDSAGDLTVTSTTVTFSTMRTDAVSYVYKDFGVDFFTHVEVEFEFEITPGQQSSSWAILLALSNTIGTFDSHSEGIFVYTLGSIGNLRLALLKRDGGVAADFSTIGATNAPAGPYYCTFTRVGSNVTVDIYTDSGRTILFDTLNVSSSTPGGKRYVYTMMSKGDAFPFTASGYTQNYELTAIIISSSSSSSSSSSQSSSSSSSSSSLSSSNSSSSSSSSSSESLSSSSSSFSAIAEELIFGENTIASVTEVTTDIYIDSESPDTSFSTGEELIFTRTEEVISTIPIKLDLSELDSRSIDTIDSAVLWLKTTSETPDEVNIAAYGLNKEISNNTTWRYVDEPSQFWELEGGHNWLIPRKSGGDHFRTGETKIPISANQWITWDVTSAVRNQFNTKEYYGFILRYPIEDGDDTFGEVIFYSSKSSNFANRPYLIVEFTALSSSLSSSSSSSSNSSSSSMTPLGATTGIIGRSGTGNFVVARTQASFTDISSEFNFVNYRLLAGDYTVTRLWLVADLSSIVNRIVTAATLTMWVGAPALTSLYWNDTGIVIVKGKTGWRGEGGGGGNMVDNFATWYWPGNGSETYWEVTPLTDSVNLGPGLETDREVPATWTFNAAGLSEINSVLNGGDNYIELVISAERDILQFAATFPGLAMGFYSERSLDTQYHPLLDITDISSSSSSSSLSSSSASSSSTSVAIGNFYFDGFDAGTAWPTNPGNMVDGNIGVYAGAGFANYTQLNNSNNSSGAGGFTAVEIRVYASRVNPIAFDLIPVFGGVSDGDTHDLKPSTSGVPGWSDWINITNDTNNPGPGWSWAAVGNLDCKIVFENNPGDGPGDTISCSKVELRIT